MSIMMWVNGNRGWLSGVLVASCATLAFSFLPQHRGRLTTAEVRAGISELPLPVAAKATYLARVAVTPPGHLGALLDEARRAVDIPPGSRVECRDGRPSVIVTLEGRRIPLS